MNLEARTHQEGDCYIWDGARSTGSALTYGYIWSEGKMRSVHRLVYEIANGPIPPGLQVDHLCDTPLCVNPFHLDAATNRANVLRGQGPTAINARRTHCIHGHPLSGDNLRVDGQGWRRCRECERSYPSQMAKRRGA